jgi:hypothetical protein
MNCPKCDTVMCACANGVRVIPQTVPETVVVKNISSGEDAILPDEWNDLSLRALRMANLYKPEEQLVVSV